MRYFVTSGRRTLEVEVVGGVVRVDGRETRAELRRVGDTLLVSLLLDGTSYALLARREEPGRWEVQVDGKRHRVEVLDERTRTIREMATASGGTAGPAAVRAPMPGLIVKVEVAEGDRVEAGQGVVIMEAMKMENELRAGAPGRVARIHVSAGQTVEKDQLLIDLVDDGPGCAEEEEARA